MADPSLKDIAARLERIESLFTWRIPGGGVTDPGPDPWGGGWFGGRGRFTFPFPIPIPGDPSPIDLSRLTRAQLAVAKEMIKTERFRLEALEKLVDAQLKAAGK